jgi:hypothetical protein
VVVVTLFAFAMVAGAVAQLAAAATPFLDDWSTLSGRSFAGTPAVISRAPGETEAFVSGVDSTVWHVRYDERRWQDWEGMGAPPTPSGVGIVGSPGAVSTSTGLADVFVRASNNRVWAKAYASAHWSDWYVLPAPPSNLTLASDPTVISTEAGRIELFVRGADGHVWYIAYGEGHWYGWYDLGVPPGGSVTEAPTVVSSEPGRIQVFTRSANGRMWYIAWGENRWYGWYDLGQPAGVSVASAPAVISSEPGRLQAFVRGADNHVWYIAYGESRWYGWYDLAGDIRGTPSVVASDATHIHVFARYANNDLFYRQWSNNTWNWWQNLGQSPNGIATGSPVAVSSDPSHFQIFNRVSTGHLAAIRFNGTWQPWSDLGADVAPYKQALVSSGAGRLEAFVRGQDNTIWLDRYQGNRWLGWEGMGAPPLPSGVGIVGSPGAVSTFAGLDDVFVRTSDNRIWAKAYASAHWSDWYVIPAPPANLTLASDPVVISSESGRIQLFVRGADGHVWYIAYGEGHWYGWYDIGQPPSGTVVGAPEVISSEPGRIQVFVRGTDGKAWYIAYGESRWYGWYDLGGQIQGTPSAVATDTTHIYAFARDQSNNLVYRAWANGTWAAWQSLGALPTGSLTGPPRAVSTEPGRIQVFARGQNGSLLFRAFGEGGWHGWVNLGNQLSTDPVATTWAGAGRTVHVAAIDSNNDFAHVGVDQTPPTIAASGGLYVARNEASLTSGALNVHADDDYSGVDSITLYERNSAGVRTRLSGDSRGCPSKGCETTADDWSYTLNPVALGWQTGVHHLTLEGADRAGSVSQSINWDVTYYATSWAYGGSDRSVNAPADVQSVLAAIAATGEDSTTAALLLAGLSPADRVGVEAQLHPADDPEPVQEPNILVPPDSGATAAHTFYCNWVGQQIGPWMRPLSPYLSSNNVYGAASFRCDHGDIGRAVSMKVCIQLWTVRNDGRVMWNTIQCDEQTWSGNIGPPGHTRTTYRPCSGGNAYRFYRVVATMTVYTIHINTVNPIATSTRTSPGDWLPCRAG